MLVLNKYLIMGSVAALVMSNIIVGWKSYGFGYDRATVIHQKQLNKIRADIDDANKKIKQRMEILQIAYDEIEKENENAVALADKQEQLIFTERLKYQNEIRARNNLCLTTPADADRLR
jgi:hypothetical protein